MKNRRLYEFGSFRVDADERILLRDSESLRMPPKTFDLLLALIENRNRIVNKDELMNEVWADSFVEEANLTVHISALRKIFNGGNYIETVPRRGYRFNAEVREINDEAANASNIELTKVFSDETARRENPEIAAAETKKSELNEEASDAVRVKHDSSAANILPTFSRNKTKIIFAISAVLLIIYASGYFWSSRNGKPAPASQKIERIPGTEKSVAIAVSPDGAYLAHAVSNSGKRSLHILHIASNSSLQLVPPTDVNYPGLTFSNDGGYVYYAQTAKDSSTLYKIPILGGDAKEILANVAGEISFSPDGKQFAFVRKTNGQETALMIADADGGNERIVSRKTAPEYLSVYEISWSPDGKTIVCAKAETNKKSRMQIVAVNVETGEEIIFSDKKWSGADGLAWLSDGSGIVAAAFDPATAPTQIWILPYPSGEPYQITNDLNNYGSIGLTADSKILLAGQFETTSGIWLISDLNSGQPKAVKHGKHHQFNFLSWTNDGRILYASSASGNRDVWTINADGSNQKQLTANDGENIQPVASPDNRYIVFSSDRATEGTQNIWRMDLDGTNPVRLTNGSGEFQPVVSPDGKWVIYTSESARTETPNPRRTIWKVPTEGGEPIQLVSNPSQWADISPDGKTFACWYKPDEKSSWKIAVFPLEGGQPIKILDLTPNSPVHWTPDGKEISFIKTVDGVSNIWSQPLGGEAKQLTEFTTEQISNFDWSSDNRLICSRGVTNRDTILISDFR